MYTPLLFRCRTYHKLGIWFQHRRQESDRLSLAQFCTKENVTRYQQSVAKVFSGRSACEAAKIFHELLMVPKLEALPHDYEIAKLVPVGGWSRLWQQRPRNTSLRRPHSRSNKVIFAADGYLWVAVVGCMDTGVKYSVLTGRNVRTRSWCPPPELS